MEACHILFQEEDKDSYVEAMLENATMNETTAASIKLRK
jgi:hypothetical protein